jgi:hypothetical protein
MHTSARSAFLHCSGTTSVTSRTAVYGPVRTVVWQGSAGDCRPYADQVGYTDKWFGSRRCKDPRSSMSELSLAIELGVTFVFAWRENKQGACYSLAIRAAS